MVLDLSTLSDSVLYFHQVCQIKVSQRVSDLETQTVGSTLGLSQVTKGHNFVKTVNGFKVIFVLNLCISSDYALYLYHVSRKNLKAFQSY